MLLVRGTEDRILPFESTAKRLPSLVEELTLVPVEGGQHNIGPAALPNGRVRSSERGLDLVWFEERDLALLRALLGDGQREGDELGVFGVTQCREAIEREERGEGGRCGRGRSCGRRPRGGPGTRRLSGRQGRWN
jgi:hypothetical protein